MAIEPLAAVIAIDCNAAVAILKFTPVCEAPLMETFWLAGLKLTPVLLGVTV